ncbi:hypothetical protein [Deinococcus sp. QL22]|uniref:hypothetical protein n=1 Tax=Deinococcus sp. QL22 TaxID=2939437 RepID=UPI002017DBA9|nr:hypothetical protein [Deinococcus sp. QL22]UQN10400.1 hypothetical protein M1R55_30060 [Deinococcus sp. QL22]UQN10534.1 hypothetical protein M1R55_29385 [Deinococcus sp. QL22]
MSKAIEARIEAELDALPPQFEALVKKLTPYHDEIGAAPVLLLMELTVHLTRMLAVAKVALTEAEYAEFQKMFGSKAPDAALDPFFAARDAQLTASRARFRIEQHLNSLSQGGLEQLASALAEGGRLMGVVRR